MLVATVLVNPKKSTPQVKPGPLVQEPELKDNDKNKRINYKGNSKRKNFHYLRAQARTIEFK